MNTDKQNPVSGTAQSKFSLVRAISEFLKLGDDGKLDSFFTRVIKTLEKEKVAFNKNLDNLKFNHEQKLDELKDSLEDAKAALDEQYLKVSVDKIGTNEAQKDFMESYLTAIDTHELAVTKIEKQIESLKEGYKADKERIEKQIESLNKRITKISA